jgi:hypothetical protein
MLTPVNIWSCFSGLDHPCWLARDGAAVMYALHMYEKVVSVLSNKNWHRLELLGPGSLVPAPTLSAFRCAALIFLFPNVNVHVSMPL